MLMCIFKKLNYSKWTATSTVTFPTFCMLSVPLHAPLSPLHPHPQASPRLSKRTTRDGVEVAAAAEAAAAAEVAAGAATTAPLTSAAAVGAVGAAGALSRRRTS